MRNSLFALSILFGIASYAQETSPKESSSLFRKGAWEFKSFQNLYSQAKTFDADGRKIYNTIGRQIWLTSINELLYKVNGTINVGAEVWIKNARNISTNESRTGITGLGPKIRIVPFKKLGRLTIQSTLLIPLTNDLEGRENFSTPFVEIDASVWINQFFYYIPVSNKTQLFFQQAFWNRFVKNSFVENDFIQSQSSVFYSYFPSEGLVLYVMTEYFPTHYDSSPDGQRADAFYSYFLHSGLGAKYKIQSNIELELLYTNFWKGSEGQGAGETVGLGIRVEL